MGLIEDGHVKDGAFGLQYGIKKLPEGEIQLEFDEARRIADEYGIATLAEELFRGRFESYQNRLFEARTRQAFNFIFGPESRIPVVGPLLNALSPAKTDNITIYARARTRFVTSAVNKGANAKEAEEIWKSFSDYAADSNIRKAVRDKKTGEWEAARSGTSLYMTPQNIPNGDILYIAHEALKRMNEGSVPAHLKTIAWQDVFREATSPIMRMMNAAPGPIGPKLQRMYTDMRYHQFITTAYYWFRFATDFRYHAMNYFEGNMLYAGRSACAPASWTAASWA